jgi:hypothetical protein
MSVIAERDSMTYIGHIRMRGAHTYPNDYLVAAKVEKADCAKLWLNTKSSFRQVRKLHNSIPTAETQIVMVRTPQTANRTRCRS